MSLTATDAPETVASRRPNRSPHHWLTRFDMKYSPYFYIAPFFVLFAIFGLYPLVYTAWVSLNHWVLAGQHEFIGLDNYVQLVQDDYFWNSLYNTIGMFVIATVPQLIIAMALANLLNRELRARTALRMGILVPNVTSVAAVGIVFGFIFSSGDYGMVNWILHFFGVDPVNWPADRWSAWTAISVMVDWRWTGYNALIFLAAMQAIPRDMYEAAAIDGASRWRQFWSITVPMLRPTLVFTSIISTIGGLQLFTEPLLFANGKITGGTTRQFQTITMYMYEQAFSNYRYGYGSAVAWALFLLIVLFSVINFALIRKSVR